MKAIKDKFSKVPEANRRWQLRNADKFNAYRRAWRASWSDEKRQEVAHKRRKRYLESKHKEER